ncbi:MAG: ankyrin repeat domain-containing protein [Acidobacteriota bacterium]|nr:ankyrin repeat domain-containing protein [Acidobacteriota bacterium]
MLRPADPATSGEVKTPLHFAVQNHLIEIAKVLIVHRAEVDAQDNYGNIPLFRAVFESRGRGDMIQLLLANGANPHINKSGVTPLGLAQTISNYDVAQHFKEVV